ncbi:Uncharacterised protein [Streptococcus pneumoniae]|nr:Uncharacterised protein [Streptococcus pneumoniae]
MRTFFLYSSAFKKHSSPSPINDGLYHLLLQSLYNILELIHDIFQSSKGFILKSTFTNLFPHLFNGFISGVYGGIKVKPILVGIFKVLDLCHIALSIRVKDNHLDKLVKALLKRRSSTQYYIHQLLRKMIRLYRHQQLHNNSEILIYSDYGYVDLLLLEPNKIPVY